MPVEYVKKMLYISGSQPFPSRGPLDKFCLGSRTTKNVYIFWISDDLFSHFPFKFFLGYIGGRMQNIGGRMHGPSPLPPQILGEPSPGPPKRFFQISQFPCISQGQGQKKHSIFICKLVVTQSIKMYQVLVHTASSENSLKRGGVNFSSIFLYLRSQ